jgi:hypothetical protein
MEYAGFVGLIVRLIGAIYAMLSAYFFFDGRRLYLWRAYTGYHLSIHILYFEPFRTARNSPNPFVTSNVYTNPFNHTILGKVELTDEKV